MRTKHLGLALAAAALLGAAAGARAQLSLDFDGPGTGAQQFAPAGVTIAYGIYLPSFDEFGDPVPGSEHWEIDPGAGSVPVLDPATVGWGSAPSPFQALDARDGTVVIAFDTPISFTSFSLRLDNSTLGNLFDQSIEFYGAGNAPLFAAPVDQSIPGFTVNVGSLSGVSMIVLPSTAFYDNIVAVPEPGTCLVGLGCLALALLRARRRHA